MDTTSDLGTILSVWAHPDDETYLAGAVMASAAAAGQRVVCVSATLGEHGTDDPRRWPPERLGAVRAWEAAAAMAVLGVREHRVLGLPDGGLDQHDATGVARVGALLDEVVPDTILTFGPDGRTFHPDHLAVHRWVTEAWAQRGRPGRLLWSAVSAPALKAARAADEAAGIYMGDLRPVGVPADAIALQVRATGSLLDRKLTALRAMATQTAAVLPRLEAVDLSEETFVEARVDGIAA